MDRLAKAARLPPARIMAHFTDPYALLPALVEHITHETRADTGPFDKHSTPHDRLFETMMARFDSLQKHRRAVLNIMAAARSNSRIALGLLSSQHQAMRAMLEAANYIPEKKHIFATSTGLLGVHIATTCVWSRDQTIDMSRTMSVLDRLLHHMDRVAEVGFRFI
jgi:AcrR family transcriptional regulator